MLLQPLRARIDKLAAEARACLETEFYNAEATSPGYDFALDALERLEAGEFVAVGQVAQDLRSEVNAAIEGREGFDTWEKKARDEFIAKATKLATRFADLARAIAELQKAESAEIALLRGALAT